MSDRGVPDPGREKADVVYRYRERKAETVVAVAVRQSLFHPTRRRRVGGVGGNYLSTPPVRQLDTTR